jgi:hypothetical protein
MHTRTSFILTSGSIWVSCYIKSGRTARENVFQSRIQGNVCLLPSDGLFPRIYFHGNVFTEPLLSSRWFLDCDWRLVCRRYVVANGARTNGRWSCRGPRWAAGAWFNVGGSHTRTYMCLRYVSTRLESLIQTTLLIEGLCTDLWDYPHWDWSWFPSFLPGKCWVITWN